MLVHYGEHCMAQKNVLLSQDNPCPPSAVVTVDAIRQLKFELLLPPIAVSDYHMFGPLKDALHG